MKPTVLFPFTNHFVHLYSVKHIYRIQVSHICKMNCHEIKHIFCHNCLSVDREQQNVEDRIVGEERKTKIWLTWHQFRISEARSVSRICDAPQHFWKSNWGEEPYYMMTCTYRIELTESFFLVIFTPFLMSGWADWQLYERSHCDCRRYFEENKFM